MARPTSRRITTLEAVASPARQEIISALGEGAATVRELARRLGRSRQSLYYHLELLERAGVVRPAGWRGTGRDRERVYRVPRGPIDARAGSAADLATAEEAVRAMLRLTSRELAAALRSGDPPPNATVAMRGKAHLDRAALIRLQALITEIQRLLRRSNKPGPSRRLVAVTVVVTPAGRATPRPTSAGRRPRRLRPRTSNQ
jgi:DNA-binding transcriptional ArsR family regulator